MVNKLPNQIIGRIIGDRKSKNNKNSQYQCEGCDKIYSEKQAEKESFYCPKCGGSIKDVAY